MAMSQMRAGIQGLRHKPLNPPYKYLSGESSDGGPSRQYQKSPLSGNGNSRPTTETEKSPRSRKYPKRPSLELYNYDYEFWVHYNDWKRSRTEYEARPETWESRIKRSFDGLDSVQGRAKRYKFEVESRTYLTEERLERMLERRQNCEIDCNYPSQCHTERYEALMKSSEKATGGTFHPTNYDEDDEMPDVDDEDEIFAAYKRDVDAWYASTLAKTS
ncbi:hypothetical protein J7337_000240 [Fusarium musae]|uniref:Uncharacterized protein n=1 Tax=Fusarium musae TaxID=1042133 RepID=A0A9P8ITC1_9HYPO|nr:hypothetical protein J7337_000240 [Fusarium musae]KAG9506706.1 hypothetical protein J7337_000240 [Fusarium musae]